MTVKMMIELLCKLEEKYGKDIEVVFDCPRCGISYVPSIAVTQKHHFKSEKEFK